MLRRGLIAIIGLTLVLPRAAARAQEPAGLEEGVRVRISAPPLGLYGETGTVDLTGRGGMVVVLDDGERVRVPYPAVARLEVSRGEHRAIALGAAAGALTGILVVVAASEPTWEEWSERGDDGLDGGAVFLGAVAGAALGGVIGSAVTYESWRPVPWVRFAGRDRGFGAGLVIETRFDTGR